MHKTPVEQSCTWSIRVSSEKSMSYQLAPEHTENHVASLQ